MGIRRRRAPVADPIPADHHAVPRSGSRAAAAGRRPAGLLLRQPRAGPAPADHADGHRRLPGDGLGIPGPGGAPPDADPRRAGRDSRSPPTGSSWTRRRSCARRSGRAIMPRALDVMEARSAVVLRRLFDDPRLSVRPGSRRRFVRPALTLAAPDAGAAGRRAGADQPGRRAAPGAPARRRGAGPDVARRRRHREARRRCRRAAVRRVAVRAAEPAGRGRRLRRARVRRPAAARLDRARRPAGGAAQRAGQRHHRDGPAAVARRRARAGRRRVGVGAAHRRPPASWRTGTGGARCPPCCSAAWRSSSDATATGPSPRSISACRGGRRTRRTCSACCPGTCGSTRTRRRPSSTSRRARARRRAMVLHAGAPRPPPRPAARGRRPVLPAAGPGARRDARDAEVPDDHRVRPRARGDARDRRRARRFGPDRGAGGRLLPRLRRGQARRRRGRPAGADRRAAAAVRRGSCGAGTSPGAALGRHGAGGGRRARGGAEGALAGTPASAGTVTALARVVLDPVGARLEPGEILVAPSTDPGWTPLFLTAGGLVMEMGGANSHGAVVAREYGIPAVVGVPRATEADRDGRRGDGRRCQRRRECPVAPRRTRRRDVT